MAAESSLQNIIECGFSDLPQVLRDLTNKHEAKTFIGTMLTSKGVLIVLFSHRYNREIALVVAGTDTAKVQSRVFETLGLPQIVSEKGGLA